MSFVDFIRKVLFTGVFLFYGGYTIWEYQHYDPHPRDHEAAQMKWENAGVDISELQNGDLILRHGKGFVSEAMQQFSRKEKRYSHSGILHWEAGQPYVYHSTGGESAKDNSMMKESLQMFLHPDICFEFGLFRYDISQNEVVKMDRILTEWYANHLEFDLDFDLESDEKMYCSEMIAKALASVTKTENFIPLSIANGKPYIAVDDLYINEHTEFLFSHVYE